MKYRVILQAYVEADSPEEARDTFEFKEHEDLKVIEVLDNDGARLPEVPDFVVIDIDRDADRSERRGADMITLEMIAYKVRHEKPAKVTDSLCDIDFFEASNAWVRGTFYRVGEIPEACEYLREIARDMRLPE